MKQVCLIFLFILISCDYVWKGKDQFQFTGNQANVQFEALDSDLDVQELLETKCLSCHAWINDFDQITSRIDFDDVKNSPFFTVIENEQMPPGDEKLSAIEKNLVLSFLQGIVFSKKNSPQLPNPNPSPLPTPTPTPVIVTFDEVKKEVFDKKCIFCHAWLSNEEQTLTRVSPGEPELSSLFQIVESGAMPPGPGQLDEDELELIKDYILGLDND